MTSGKSKLSYFAQSRQVENKATRYPVLLLMRSIVIDRWQSPAEVMVSLTDPPPLPDSGCVRVQITYAGVNFADVLMVQGKYQDKPRFPFIPGSEFSGIVTEISSDVRRFKTGDKVFGGAGLSAWGEEIVLSEDKLHHLPPGMSLEEAGGFSITYPTSYYALKHRANLRSRETLLVHAGAGGVGVAAIQIGKAFGARVIATAGSEEKLRVCRECGADEVINYRKEDFVPIVKKLTGGMGVDVVFDPVGGETFTKSTRVIGWNGRILVIGFACGTIPTMKVNRCLIKGCSVVGVWYGQWTLREPDGYPVLFDDLRNLYVQGKIRPVNFPKGYTLDTIPVALHDIASRKTYGKVIVKVADTAQPANL